MKILDRYIGWSVIINMVVVMVVLLSLFTFVGFFEEVDYIGKGRYGVSEAILYIVLSLPSLISQLMPMTALLGCTVGLGMLAGNSELVAIRSAGVSLRRIVWSVMKVGILAMVFVAVVGEWVGPHSERLAQTLRSVALSNQLSMGGKQGLWAKDGTNIINARKFLPGERLGEIYIYEMDDQHRLIRLIQAQTASYRNERWILENVLQNELKENQVITAAKKELAWDTTISPDLLSVVTVKPNTLSTWGLYQYIEYLQANGLSSSNYVQAFWSKLASPLATGIMVLLAIPFVFGPLRSVSVGQRVLVGVLTGVAFHLLTQTFAYVGLVFKLNSAFSVFLPLILAAMAAYWLFKRVY
ncbi:MAG: LPS export ABC transporter permease LptG [Gammaproteobacteria bacterium]|nr:LPS export ABC transporter permease LptG [Gammaproteobacteria bacterium]MDH5803357.1 LPS export ABC transporter permease LptG [Gammaproteobacteria bacterium]